MGLPRYIWVRNTRYFLYDVYSDWRDAYNVARYQKKKTRTKYYIMMIESGVLFPQTKYALYFSKVIGFW